MDEIVYVKIVEETIYLATEEDYEATLTPNGWEALDKTKRYRIVAGAVEEIPPMVVEEPPSEVPSEPLVVPQWITQMNMYTEAGVMPAERLEALWSAIALNDTTKITAIQSRLQP